MTELQHYSGPFNPDLKFEDFSKDFLIKLIREYQPSYMRLNRLWYERVAALVGTEKHNGPTVLDKVWRVC